MHFLVLIYLLNNANCFQQIQNEEALNHYLHVFISWMAISIMCRVATNITTIWSCVITYEISHEKMKNKTYKIYLMLEFTFIKWFLCFFDWDHVKNLVFLSDVVLFLCLERKKLLNLEKETPCLTMLFLIFSLAESRYYKKSFGVAL